MEVTETQLREHLRDPNPAIRAQWQGRILREARKAGGTTEPPGGL